jgi:hypothetical protein
MPPLHGFSAQATEVTEVRFFGGNDHEVGGLAIVLRLVPDVAANEGNVSRPSHRHQDTAQRARGLQKITVGEVMDGLGSDFLSLRSRNAS